jgi:hypothetical protein
VSYDKDDRISKAKRILNLWQTRNLTMYGRCQIIKSFVTSQFVFTSSVIVNLPSVIKAVKVCYLSFCGNMERTESKG